MMVPGKHKTEQGFSLLEMMIVVGVMFVLASMAVISYVSSNQNYIINGSLDSVVSQLRTARSLAISKRRNVQVWIDPTTTNTDKVPHVLYQVIALTGEAPYSQNSAMLSIGTTMTTFTGQPDTPMAFGNTSAVYINGMSGGPPTMMFSTSGSFVDTNGNPINGTIFLGMPNQPNTARAVTILGATGRVRAYYWNGTQWFE